MLLVINGTEFDFSVLVVFETECEDRFLELR